MYKFKYNGRTNEENWYVVMRNNPDLVYPSRVNEGTPNKCRGHLLKTRPCRPSDYLNSAFIRDLAFDRENTVCVVKYLCWMWERLSEIHHGSEVVLF